ncbi:kinase-like domain-containing protein, partial [Mycena galopus ATCC 62051]
FTKEALMWHSPKHGNIVPFLGFNSTTFPNPTSALVSLWMTQGSVLQYIERNSPVAPYALDDVIQGLSYLHSASVVHGDLNGRNILVDERGRARLADFGLSALIKPEPELSSTRWMSPELRSPLASVSFPCTIASNV